MSSLSQQQQFDTFSPPSPLPGPPPSPAAMRQGAAVPRGGLRGCGVPRAGHSARRLHPRVPPTVPLPACHPTSIPAIRFLHLCLFSSSWLPPNPLVVPTPDVANSFFSREMAHPIHRHVLCTSVNLDRYPSLNPSPTLFFALIPPLPVHRPTPVLSAFYS